MVRHPERARWCKQPSWCWIWADCPASGERVGRRRLRSGRLVRGSTVDETQCPATTGNTLPAHQVPFPEADLLLTTTTLQRILELGPLNGL